MKAENQMLRVQIMNSIRCRAENHQDGIQSTVERGKAKDFGSHVYGEFYPCETVS